MITFNSDGLLDPKTYEATFVDIRSGILVLGDGGSSVFEQSRADFKPKGIIKVLP